MKTKEFTINEKFTQELENKLADIIILMDARNIVEDNEIKTGLMDQIISELEEISTEELELMTDFMNDLRKLLFTEQQKTRIAKCWDLTTLIMLGEEIDNRKEEENEE